MVKRRHADPLEDRKHNTAWAQQKQNSNKDYSHRNSLGSINIINNITSKKIQIEMILKIQIFQIPIFKIQVFQIHNFQNPNFQNPNYQNPNY